MEYVCIIIIVFAICIILGMVLKLNPKKIKQIAENDELNKLAEKFPTNMEICKQILKMLKNENVKIEEDNNTKDCLYMVAFNKIIISGAQNNFTRIQTIAHECLHSVQEKRIQIFNFVFSNVCIFYFIAIILLCIFKILPFKMFFLATYILLGFTHFVIRAYLENDAMIKAKYLAKEYMEEQGACTKDEIDKLVEGFEKINSMGIKGYNFSLMFGYLVKTSILAIFFVLF